MRSIYQYLPILFLLAACTKIDVPGPDTSEPVFTLDLGIDGQSQEWTAGIDSLFMYTNFSIDSLNIYTFEGILQPEGCSSICPPALQFEIRDFQQVLGGNVAIQQALATGNYTYRDQKIDTTYSYRILFETMTFPNDPSNSSFSWTFSNGQTSSNASVFLILNNPDPVSFTVEANLSGYTASRTGTVYFDTLTNNCAVDFDAVLVQGGSMLQVMATQVDGAPPFQYEWEPGAQLTGSSIFYPLDSFGITLPELICLTQTDNLGCTVETCNTVFVDSPVGGSVDQTELIVDANPFVNVNTAVADYEQFSKVRLTYHDSGGKVYRSDRQEQGGSTFFEILESQPFDNNANGIPTYQLTIRFQTTLWDAFGNPLTINGEGTIAVGYPD